MKVAVLFSGQLRTFEQCWPTIRWQVLRHYPGADLFFSLVADAGSRAWTPPVVPTLGGVCAELVDQPDFAEWSGEYAAHAPFAISTTPQAILRQLWHLWRVWEFCGEQNAARGEYDLVIRCRPDLWFHSFRPPMKLGEDAACTPWWGRFGGVNDRFALLGPQSAAAYFGTFSHLGTLLRNGCPLHPESLVAASLELCGCRVFDKLATEFSTLRTDGTRRAPEILTSDLAHAALPR